MNKLFFLFSFLFLLACNDHNQILEPETDEEDKWEKPNPPVVIVDSTYVLIGDTVKVTF